MSLKKLPCYDSENFIANHCNIKLDVYNSFCTSRQITIYWEKYLEVLNEVEELYEEEYPYNLFEIVTHYNEINLLYCPETTG